MHISSRVGDLLKGTSRASCINRHTARPPYFINATRASDSERQQSEHPTRARNPPRTSISSCPQPCGLVAATPPKLALPRTSLPLRARNPNRTVGTTNDPAANSANNPGPPPAVPDIRRSTALYNRRPTALSATKAQGLAPTCPQHWQHQELLDSLAQHWGTRAQSY